MIPVLFVEGSLCLDTGAAGWGGLLEKDGAETLRSGFLAGPFARAVTLMELSAVQRAVGVFLARGDLSSPLVLASRSTAALAVLRWVFPDVPFEGDVERPKRLKAQVRDYHALYDLHEDVERAGLDLRLRQVRECAETYAALMGARGEMTRARRRCA